MTMRGNSTHKPTAAVLEALQAAGWVYVSSKFPGNATFRHPLSGSELPTPDYMVGSPAWPFETFYRLRQVTFNYTGDRIDALWTNQCAAPWVRSEIRKTSFARTVEFIQEEWTP